MGARRTNDSVWGCRRGISTSSTLVPFVGAGTSTLGQQELSPELRTVDPNRWFGLLSDSSARTYVFSDDITDLTRRYGAGVAMNCALYRSEGNVATRVIDTVCGSSFQTCRIIIRIGASSNFAALCGVPAGSSLQNICSGRYCGRCTLAAPIECLRWDSAHSGRLQYVPENVIESPVALDSAVAPWDGDPNNDPVLINVHTDATGTNWPYPIKSMRSYDTGACRVLVRWSAISSSINRAVLAQVAGGLADESGVVGVYRVHVNGTAGAQLRGNSLTADDAAYVSVDVDDSVISIVTGGFRRVWGHAFTRFSVAAIDTNGALPGGMRVSVPYITGWTDHLPNNPYEIGAKLSEQLSAPNGLQRALPNAINNALIVPVLRGASGFVPCVSPWNGSPNTTPSPTECERVFAGSPSAAFFAGPERGCYRREGYGAPWTSMPGFPTTGPGVCGTRLQPYRVNVLPEGLQLVVAEHGRLDQSLTMGTPAAVNEDPLYPYIEWLASLMALTSPAVSDVNIECDTTTSETQRTHLVEASAVSASAGETAACTERSQCEAYGTP